VQRFSLHPVASSVGSIWNKPPRPNRRWVWRWVCAWLVALVVSIGLLWLIVGATLSHGFAP
jgi:hypothetical protein